MSTFKILKPTKMTDDILVSTNVHETAPDVHDDGTTYSDGDFIHVVNGSAIDIYESLQPANTGNAPATSGDWWRYISSTYAEYDADAAYDEGDKIMVSAEHTVYYSLQTANAGNAPATSGSWWIETGSTNPWISFDAKVGSQTQRAGAISFELAPGLVEGIAFFNLYAATIDVVLTDPVEGVVFNTTVDLIQTTNVFDAYSYCFSEILTSKNHVVTEIPPYSGATLQISINAGSDADTAKCGEIVFGRVSSLGLTQYSPYMEILDFSTKSEDDYGNFEVIERPFKKGISCDITIINSMLEYVQNIFEEYRATAAVWIITETATLLSPYLAYAFYKRFTVITKYLSKSTVTIELIGLT